MSNLQVRLPRQIVLGVLLSIVVMLVAATAIYNIELAVKTSPFAKMHAFAAINGNNPSVYQSHLHSLLAPQEENFDQFVATPISLLLAGAAYGFFLRKLPWIASRRFRAALITGFAFSTVLMAFDITVKVYLTPIVARLVGETGPVAVPGITEELAFAIVSGVLLGGAAYTLGAWLVTLPARPAAASLPARKSTAA